MWRTLLNLIQRNQALIKNAISLVGATAVTSGLGFVYWWFAARLFEPHDVGFAAAAISAMMLLGVISVLGFGSLLIAELPRQRGHEASLIVTALLLVGSTGFIAGSLFAIIAPYLSPNLAMLGENYLTIALFGVGVATTTVVQVLDQALVGLLRGDVQFWRNALFALVKLLLLVGVGIWVTQIFHMSIYATWLGGNILSMAVVVWFGLTRGHHLRQFVPRATLLRAIGRSALTHHALNLALSLPSYAIPLVVTIMLSAAMNAYFYTAWMIAGFALVGPLALTTALYAVGARNPELLAQKLRLTLRLTVLGGIAANAVLLLGSEYILRVFGAEYAVQAASALRIMGLAIFPLIIQDHYIVIQRIHQRVSSTILLISLGSALQIGLAAFGASIGGLTGLATGWLIANCVAAAFMARGVYHVARPSHVPAASNEFSTV